MGQDPQIKILGFFVENIYKLREKAQNTANLMTKRYIVLREGVKKTIESVIMIIPCRRGGVRWW